MTTPNAAGFFLLGLLMNFLPVLLPGCFPPTGVVGSNTSALWLEFMGMVQGTLGAFFGLRNEVMPWVIRLLTWRLPQPEPGGQPAPGVILRPSALGYLAVPPDGGRQLAA
jgi:hypothetical protein